MAFGDARGETGDVGGEDDVVALPEGVVAGERLDFIDVEGGAGDFLGFEGVVEVVELDDDAAADVDEDGVALHFPDAGAVEEAFGLGGMRGADDDEVGLGEEVVEAGGGQEGVDAFGGFGLVGIGGDDFHAEGFAAAGDFLADVAEADDAEGEVGEAAVGAVNGADEAGAGGEAGASAFSADGIPGGLALAADVEVEVAREAGDVAEDLVGDDIGEEAAHVGEGAGVLDEGVEDVVLEAGGGGLDPAELGGGGEELGGDLAEEGVGVGDFGLGLGRLGAIGDGHVAGGLADLGEALIVDGRMDDELHGS